MDTMARALRAVAKLQADGSFDAMLTKRYAGFADTEIGRRFAEGAAMARRARRAREALGA